MNQHQIIFEIYNHLSIFFKMSALDVINNEVLLESMSPNHVSQVHYHGNSMRDNGYRNISGYIGFSRKVSLGHRRKQPRQIKQDKSNTSRESRNYRN